MISVTYIANYIQSLRLISDIKVLALVFLKTLHFGLEDH